MGLFNRRKRADAAGEPDDVEPDVVQEPEHAGPERPQGPWDEDDAPDDGLQRLDLGGLRVPVPPNTEVRVEVSPEGQVVAATLVRAQSAMQVSAFAAPRTEGIWPEVREEISSALRERGGSAQEVDGPLGVELRTAVPTDVPGRGRVLVPQRFVGVDGPRWFLRAVLTGPAAVDSSAARDLEAALRSVVVVRGGDPMAVRDPLPLRLPKGVQDAAQQQAAAQQAAGRQQAAGQQRVAGQQPSARQAPRVPERGPEITEIR